MSSVLGVGLATSNYDVVVDHSLRWAQRRESRTVVFANVHVVMEAFDDSAYRDCLNRADLVNPDGVPLVWALKLLKQNAASRVYGPDCTLALIRAAERANVEVGFYGGSQQVLDELIRVVRRDNPALIISFAMSPPFRRISQEEDAHIVRQIIDSGVRILFVGLGCPKQEKWMDDHRLSVPAVMLGVGAAFDFIAGSKRQAPRWMMQLGLEWVFRLATEPKRLARRYLKNNPRFVLHFARQLFSSRTARAEFRYGK